MNFERFIEAYPRLASQAAAPTNLPGLSRRILKDLDRLVYKDTCLDLTRERNLGSLRVVGARYF